MSYHIYTTKALVLSARPSGEADRLYSVLTEEFGLVRAKASGVRKEVSKLRAALEPLSFSTVSFVRGKEHWRITSAHLESNLAREFKGQRSVLVAFTQALSLLERLVVGEESHPELLMRAYEAADFARRAELDERETKALEVWLVVQILFELGYVPEEEFAEKIFMQPLSKELLALVAGDRKKLIELINSGLRATGLIKESGRFKKKR